MLRWLKRCVLKAQLMSAELRLREEEEAQAAVLIERWLALDAMDAASYDYFSAASTTSKNAQQQLRNQRDEIVQKLQKA